MSIPKSLFYFDKSASPRVGISPPKPGSPSPESETRVYPGFFSGRNPGLAPKTRVLLDLQKETCDYIVLHSIIFFHKVSAASESHHTDPVSVIAARSHRPSRAERREVRCGGAKTAADRVGWESGRSSGCHPNFP